MAAEVLAKAGWLDGLGPSRNPYRKAALLRDFSRVAGAGRFLRRNTKPADPQRALCWQIIIPSYATAPIFAITCCARVTTAAEETPAVSCAASAAA